MAYKLDALTLTPPHTPQGPHLAELLDQHHLVEVRREAVLRLARPQLEVPSSAVSVMCVDQTDAAASGCVASSDRAALPRSASSADSSSGGPSRGHGGPRLG